jgi:membrane-bound lytic murein transglycosylase D
MQVARLQLRVAMLAAVALAASSCQTAQKPAPLLPAKGAAPPVTAQQISLPPQQTAKPEPAPPPSAAQVATPPPTKTDIQTQTPLSPRDRVADLLAQVEKDYQTGLTAYGAGQTDQARQYFDKACNALLDSDLDIRSDDRLEKEFEHIVTGVNQLNLDSSKAESDLQSEAQKDAQKSESQKTEPAPIDETSGIVPSADPKVEAKARAEIKVTHSDLPLMMTDQVAGYISYFSNRGRGTFERAFARSGRYRAMMLPILKQEGVPQDLIYLAQAESGFHPLAVSRAGARGIWQFMGSRGQAYGLHHGPGLDERQDPVKSTRAAARHLKDLYAEFGDWYLAMAAYNSGPGTVQAAVKRTGYADFWELYRRNVLPKETRNYVPIILAVTIMTKNMSHYGFDDVSMDDPEIYDSVAVDYPVDLRLVADCVDSTAARIQELNPSLLRLSTPKEGTFELHLPPRTKDQYQTTIAAIPNGMRLWWRYHKVQPGDTVASLARTYRVTAQSIVNANQFDGSDLPSDARLIIPLAPGKHPSGDTVTYARSIIRYQVRKGDTVETVAENFGVPAQMVRRWNGLRGDSLRGRKALALHLPVTPNSEVASASGNRAVASRKHVETPSATHPAGRSEIASLSAASEPPTVVRHKVKSGETLYSIATAYNTTVAALKRNNGDLAVLHPGMILIVQPAR